MGDAPAEPASIGDPAQQAEKLAGEDTEQQLAAGADDSEGLKGAVSRDEKSQQSDTASENNQARSPVHSRQGSRPPDMNRSANIPKRPELSRLPPPPSLPNKPDLPRGYRHDGRPPRQPDLIDDRRDGRHPELSRSGRYNDAERDRQFDHDSRGHGRSDDQYRGPRDNRGPPREPETDRAGRLRPQDSFPRDSGFGPRSGSQPQPHPDRADALREHPDRVALIEVETQRRDHGRSDRDDRRPRPQSPARTDDRRSHRHDDYPTGPRSDRPGRLDMPEARDNRHPPDMSHGRLNRQPEVPTDTPSGPRSRGQARGRNVSGVPSAPSTPGGASERQPPSGPSNRSTGRGPEPSTAPPPTSDKNDTSGVHPDRLKNLPNEPPAAGGRQQAPLAAPSGPRNSHGTPGGSPATRGPPSGPGGDRSRSDKRFAGLNTMLQQSGGSQERHTSSPGTSIRSRGRQASSANASSLHDSRPPSPPTGGFDEGPALQGRPELFPSGAEEENRSSGRGRRNDGPDEANAEPRRGSRHANINTPNRDHRGEDETPRSNRRDDRRNRDRDRDREHDRNRRTDAGAEEPHPQAPRESGSRRGTGNRDDNRKRDRRERDDGATEHAGPGNNEPHGRIRPPSAQANHNNAPPQGPPGEERRWGGGGRGEPRDRDRHREHGGGGGGGRDRDREFNRGGGAASGSNTFPRKRGRPGDDNAGHGEGAGRGMRVGSESKRARRGT